MYVLRVVRLGLPLVDVSARALVEACLFHGIFGFVLGLARWAPMLGKLFPARWGLGRAFALAKVMQMVGPKILLGFHSFMDLPLYMGLASPLL